MCRHVSLQGRLVSIRESGDRPVAEASLAGRVMEDEESAEMVCLSIARLSVAGIWRKGKVGYCLACITGLSWELTLSTANCGHHLEIAAVMAL